jgi:hypothetical protein
MIGTRRQVIKVTNETTQRLKQITSKFKVCDKVRAQRNLLVITESSEHLLTSNTGFKNLCTPSKSKCLYADSKTQKSNNQTIRIKGIQKRTHTHVYAKSSKPVTAISIITLWRCLRVVVVKIHLC